MPELPEVEVIRRGLQAKLPGRQVQGVEVRESRIVVSEAKEFEKSLVGQTIREVGRQGKYLSLVFERHALLVHLRMTGQLTFWNASQPDAKDFYRQPQTGLQRIRQHPIDKHTHFIIYWQDGHALYYRDIRKFGRIELLTLEQLNQHPSLLALGIEPFTDNYTFANFKPLFKGSRTIKGLLLDQHAISGLGNIYCDEALFLAGIHPDRKVNTITPQEQERLFESIVTVLNKGINFGGTTLKDYIDSEGKKGSNQESLFVYGRKGEACRQCQSPIQKTVLAQRGTHFCPHCQK